MYKGTVNSLYKYYAPQRNFRVGLQYVAMYFLKINYLSWIKFAVVIAYSLKNK